MANRVVDTNIVSYLMKDDPLSDRYWQLLVGHRLYISFMTAAELYEGSKRAHWGRRRRRELEAAIRRYVLVPSGLELCRLWGEIRYERRKQPISVDDAWIAATARHMDCPLVTHNPTDFAHLQLDIITLADD